MNILDYCRHVLRVVLTAQPAESVRSRAEWSADCDVAFDAIVLAHRGKLSAARRMASRVAERWCVR